jgi:Flp pilus assembly protein TadG
MKVRAFCGDQRGGLTTVFALALVALFMVAGVALTSADVQWTRTETHNALDAAVLAGAGLPTGTSDQERVQVAEQFYAANQIIPPHAGAEVEVNAGIPANFGTTETTVYGAASITRDTPLGAFWGTEQLTVKVNSAATKTTGTPVCVLGLDPTEEATMDFNGHASLELKECASMANSSNGAGMRQVGQPSMKAKDIGVNGGYTGSAYEPDPTTGVAPFEDPLASLPQPVPGACHARSGDNITNDTVTLTPGTYCGGISIMNSTVTLEPGIYIMYEGPFNLQAGSVVNGDEVMLAFVGEAATLYMIGDATMHLTSPVSGTYKNIQFFGDRDIYAGPNGKASNLWFTVIGGSVLTYDGVLYAPTFHVWFAGNSTIEASSPNYLAVAKKLWFQDQTSVKMEHANKRNLDDVEEVKYLEKSARLIQ